MTKSDFFKLVERMAFAQSEIIIMSGYGGEYSLWLADVNRGDCEGKAKIKSCRSRGKAEELCLTYQRWLSEFVPAVPEPVPAKPEVVKCKVYVEKGTNAQVVEKGAQSLIGKSAVVTITDGKGDSWHDVPLAKSQPNENGLKAFMYTEPEDFAAWMDVRRGDDVLVYMEVSYRYGLPGFRQIFRRPDGSDYVYLAKKDKHFPGKSMEKLLLNAIKREVKHARWFDSKSPNYAGAGRRKTFCRDLMHSLAVSLTQQSEFNFINNEVFHISSGFDTEKFNKMIDFACAFSDITGPIGYSVATDYVRECYLDIVSDEFEAWNG